MAHVRCPYGTSPPVRYIRDDVPDSVRGANDRCRIRYGNVFLPAARGELDRLPVLKTACHGTGIIPGGPAG